MQSENIYQNSKVSFKICEKAKNAICSSITNITQTRGTNNETILSAFVSVPDNRHYDITVINQIGKSYFSASGLDMSKYNSFILLLSFTRYL